jgi:anti-anti-sigma regulatory factor
MSGVSFMDRAGLWALLATQRRAEMRGGFLCLNTTSAAVRRVIERAGPLATSTRKGFGCLARPNLAPTQPIGHR